MSTEIRARLKLLKANPRPNPRFYTEEQRRRFHGSGINDADAFRVLCGFVPSAGPPCPGLLGKAEITGYGREQPNSLIAPRVAGLSGTDRAQRGDWVLSHPEGFRRNDDGSFTIMTATKRDEYGQKVGRRPLPQELNLPRLSDARVYRVVGQMPILPAVIVCSACRRQVIVERPPAPSCVIGHQACTHGCRPIDAASQRVV